MEQIERIRYMEALLDESESVIRKLADTLEHYKQVVDKIKELEAYYESPLWRNDYEDDERGKLPQNLKRGVLSQDAIYNLLCEQTEVQEELKKLLK